MRLPDACLMDLKESIIATGSSWIWGGRALDREKGSFLLGSFCFVCEPKRAKSSIITAQLLLDSLDLESSEFGMTKSRVRVVARVRPSSGSSSLLTVSLTPSATLSTSMSPSESTSTSCLTLDPLSSVLTVARPFCAPKSYKFDRVLPPGASQDSCFDASVNVPGLAEDVFLGLSGGVMCYGQTGAGKTYPMFGDMGEDHRVEVEEGCGHEGGESEGGTDEYSDNYESCGAEKIGALRWGGKNLTAKEMLRTPKRTRHATKIRKQQAGTANAGERQVRKRVAPPQLNSTQLTQHTPRTHHLRLSSTPAAAAAASAAAAAGVAAALGSGLHGSDPVHSFSASVGDKVRVL